MSLILDYRWEHALIAATVDAATRNCPSCCVGRTAIQKLLYFMNVLGVPMRYDFDIHHFGPFCAHVMHDVDWLLADEVIVDHSQEKKRYSNYRPGPGWSELSAQYHDTLSAHQQKIEAVCRALGSLAHHDLELVATLDFSFRWVRAGGGGGPWRARTIEKFKSIKKDKFPNAEIDSWYDALVGAGLIEA